MIRATYRAECVADDRNFQSVWKCRQKDDDVTFLQKACDPSCDRTGRAVRSVFPRVFSPRAIVLPTVFPVMCSRLCLIALAGLMIPGLASAQGAPQPIDGMILEVDPTAGIASVAAVAAVIALIWERRTRAP